jgi:hypothetical protein
MGGAGFGWLSPRPSYTVQPELVAAARRVCRRRQLPLERAGERAPGLGQPEAAVLFVALQEAAPLEHVQRAELDAPAAMKRRLARALVDQRDDQRVGLGGRALALRPRRCPSS